MSVSWLENPLIAQVMDVYSIYMRFKFHVRNLGRVAAWTVKTAKTRRRIEMGSGFGDRLVFEVFVHYNAREGGHKEGFVNMADLMVHGPTVKGIALAVRGEHQGKIFYVQSLVKSSDNKVSAFRVRDPTAHARRGPYFEIPVDDLTKVSPLPLT